MPEHENHAGGLFKSRSGFVLLCFLAIIGFLLFTEHRTHVLGILPFALLLLCPLLHIFHHGGHGGHDAGPSRPTTVRDGQEEVPAAPESHHHGGA